VLDFGTADRLIAASRSRPRNEWLTRARAADDLLALKALSALPESATG
jgi:ATP-dependent RNA helicase SUPV3L1/SUV3